MKYTHIAIEMPSQKAVDLYRADHGISLGVQHDRIVVYGDEPNKRKSHLFIDHEAARRWFLEVYAAQDLNDRGIEGPPVIDMRSGEGIITLPEGSMRFPDEGIRPLKN